MTRPQYEHEQVGWVLRISFACAVVLFVVLGATQAAADGTQWRELLVPLGILVLVMVLGWFWSVLTVRVDDRQFSLWFGFGWPRRAVPLADIVSAEVTRTSFISGWGMHWTLRGWLYNVSGFDAVLVELAGGKTFLVGSDEPERLKSAIDRGRRALVAGTRPRPA